jgi:tyrosine-protein kinase Etk/Wzc
MKILISQLGHIFDLVILDSPAALAVSDTAVIAPLVDAIAFVVNRTVTNSKEIHLVQTQLKKFTTKWLGVIINRAEPRNGYYYHHGKTNRKQ